VIDGVDVDTRSDQDFRLLNRIAAGNMMQKRASVPVAGVDVHAVAQ